MNMDFTPDRESKKYSNMASLFEALKPREVVEQLDKFIVGQADAKRAVAIALRNRWRRHQLSADLKNEVRLSFKISTICHKSFR